MTLAPTAPAVPEDWPGSLPEYIAYRTLERLGKRPGLDFVYQSSLMGGRIEKGGAVIDFLFLNPPDLAINVQGEYWHYELGSEVRARDVIIRQSLAAWGITLIFIDESDLLSDPEYYVRQALNYRDLSRLGRD